MFTNHAFLSLDRRLGSISSIPARNLSIVYKGLRYPTGRSFNYDRPSRILTPCLPLKRRIGHQISKIHSDLLKFTSIVTWEDDSNNISSLAQHILENTTYCTRVKLGMLMFREMNIE